MPQVAPNRPQHALGDGVYTVEASHKLPSISASKTFKSAWLPPAALQRYNRFLHRWRTLLNGCFVLASALVSVGFFCPAPIARPLATFGTLLAFPAIFANLLSLRYDMAVLLIKTFNFWYRGLALGVGIRALGFHLRDARAQYVIGITTGNLTVLLLDANFRGMKTQVALLITAALVMLLYTVVVAFAWMDDVHELTVFEVYGHTVTTRSIVANSFGLSSLLFLHSAFVRRSCTKSSNSQSLTTTTQCVLYRCRLRWQPVNSRSRLAIERRDAKRSFQEDTIQLRCAGLRQVINARKTLIRSSPQSQLAPYHWTLRLVLLSTGIIGFLSMMATFAVVAHGADLSSPVVRALSMISFATTVSVNAFFFAFVYQVEMLRLLYTSFDFVFVFIQVFIIHLCLCDLSAWDVRVYAVISSLLWMHWACVIDAIPPLKRSQLGLNVRRAAAVIQAASLVALTLFSIDLLGWHSQRFVNRDVLHDTGDQRSRSNSSANWSVGSFFFKPCGESCAVDQPLALSDCHERYR